MMLIETGNSWKHPSIRQFTNSSPNNKCADLNEASADYYNESLIDDEPWGHKKSF